MGGVYVHVRATATAKAQGTRPSSCPRHTAARAANSAVAYVALEVRKVGLPAQEHLRWSGDEDKHRLKCTGHAVRACEQRMLEQRMLGNVQMRLVKCSPWGTTTSANLAARDGRTCSISTTVSTEGAAQQPCLAPSMRSFAACASAIAS